MNNQKKYSLRKRNKENKKERRKNQDDLNRNDLSVECNNVAYRENLDYVVQGLKTTQFPFER